ncbi:MAG TPA: CoA-binding protein [Ignavibacteria bacterium]|nr:CoA-binding protein [Ignavibacteria bacterium]HMR39222.1 CoA-binding protein [Ignavibacteria bacterium]
MKTNKYNSLEEIFESNKVIAIVGFSDNHTRASNRIGRYLKGNGFTVYGINPRLAGKEVDDIICYAKIKDLPEKADIINVFRRSEFVPELMKEILDLDYKPNLIWSQIGVISRESSELAENNQIDYIENKCIMVEHSGI